MTPEENLQYWLGIRRGLAEGAEAAAGAMARYLAERTARDTLRRASHGIGEYWKADAGAPPAYASGSLADAMYWTRGTGGLRASASVGNRDMRAMMFEFGCEPVEPVHYKVMHWVDSGGSWYHKILPAGGEDFPAHPFLGPTTDEASDDGSLTEAAADAFRDYDP